MTANRSDGSDNDGPMLGLVQQGIETALELGRAGVWEVDLADNTPVFSEGYYELLGVDPQQGRREGDFWTPRVHPDDLEHMRKSFRAYSNGESRELEEVFRMRHADGRWLWLLVRGRLVAPTKDDPRRRALGFVIDVTERHKDYDRLRASEERFRLALSAIPCVIYDLDPHTGNAQRFGLERVFGYDIIQGTDDFDGWMDLIHPEDRERVIATVQENRRFARNYEMSYRMYHKDGRVRFVQHRGTYLQSGSGELIRAFGVIEDVTESRRQEEQLRLQANIIERMQEGVMLADSNAHILFTNPALDRMFGYEAGSLIGQNARVLSRRSQQAFEGLTKAVFEGVEGKRSSVVDLEGLHRDGSTRAVQCQFTGMSIGERRCVIGVMNDISDRKQLERELMLVTTRVQQRIGGDLHDGLGQQLTGIAMMLKGLVQRAEKAGSAALRAEIDGIVGLVNTAIQSTRTLARGLSPVSADREGFLEGFAELANQVFERYRIKVCLDLQLPADLVLDENTASHLYRIAQEGVTNAARHAGTDQIDVRLLMSGTDIELLVADNGQGFDPARVSRGGMGLRVMRFRAQMIGGYLAVESRPGAGTTLRCRAPVQPEAAVA